MLLFRSEEHLERWIAGAHPAGMRLTLEQQWQLARNWFAGRDRPEWTKRSATEAEAIFRRSGLTEDFWRLS
ncbi:MAG: Alkylmercury lyase [Actinomycetota bacterium]|nr:Alkylmercury lyase [Actinomycetota bacterium]